jgi:hypothetical protein
MVAEQLADNAGKEVGRDGRDGPDGETPADSNTRGICGLAHLADLGEHALGSGKKGAAGFGGDGAAAETVEERLTERLLELAHLQAEGGLCDAEAGRGFAEATLLCDRDKVAELAQIHPESI